MQHRFASVKSPRALTTSSDDSHGVVPAARTSAYPAIFVFVDGEKAGFQPRFIRSWSEFGIGNCGSSAVSLNRGMNSAMGVRASNAAAINHGRAA